MQQLVFTERAIFRLRQLSQTVLKKTGVRHRLSDQRSVLELLRFSCTTSDGEVFESFCGFTNELDEDQRTYLQGRGLLLPHVIIDKINDYTGNKQVIN